ncbi:MAG: hypothetical protein ACI4VF_04550 [Lachnospirales bacterium]
MLNIKNGRFAEKFMLCKPAIFGSLSTGVVDENHSSNGVDY